MIFHSGSYFGDKVPEIAYLEGQSLISFGALHQSEQETAD